MAAAPAEIGSSTGPRRKRAWPVRSRMEMTLQNLETTWSTISLNAGCCCCGGEQQQPRPVGYDGVGEGGDKELEAAEAGGRVLLDGELVVGAGQGVAAHEVHGHGRRRRRGSGGGHRMILDLGFGLVPAPPPPLPNPLAPPSRRPQSPRAHTVARAPTLRRCLAAGLCLGRGPRRGGAMRSRLRERRDRRDSRRHSRSRSRSRSPSRRSGRGSHSDGPRDRHGDRGRDGGGRASSKGQSGRGGGKMDYSRLIEGYDKMTPAEKVKAKMKLQLSETASKDTTLRTATVGWERFDFDKDAPLDEDDADMEVANDDASLVKHIGKSFRLSAVESKHEDRVRAAHDEAIFGVPTSLVTETETAEGGLKTNDEGEKPEYVEVQASSSLVNDKVLGMQKGSWRERAQKLRQDSNT